LRICRWIKNHPACGTREGQEFQHGVAPNELTATEDRDWFAGTPFHKHVPARIEAVA
jgi:hypothetical protein